MAKQQYNIKLPKPHPAQQKVLDGMNKYNVVSAGRRLGKSEFGKIVACKKGGVLDGMNFGWFAPNNKYLLDAWNSMKQIFKPIARNISEQHHRITLINGAFVDFWTLDDPDAGRSRRYGRVVVDEAAKVKDLRYSWEEAIGPTLADFDGDAFFLSSPKGFNYFRDIYQRGISEDVKWKDWSSWMIPTSANPYIRNEVIEEKRQTLPSIVFRQEYLGEFVDSGGTPIEREFIKNGEPNPNDVVFTSMGVDLAISQKTYADYTAIAVLQITRNGNIYIKHIIRGHWQFAETIEKIKSMALAHNPNVVCVEAVSFQQAAVQELMRTTRLPIFPFNPNKFGDKLTRFLPLASRYEQGLVHHGQRLPKEFEDELLSFPVGSNDDMIDAITMAYMKLPKINGQAANHNDIKATEPYPMLAKRGFKYGQY